MEFLPRIHHIASLHQSPRVTVKIERDTRGNSLDGVSSCRCSTTSHGDLKTIKKNASQVLNSFLFMRRDLEQDNGHSSDLDQKRNGTLLVQTVHKKKWDRIAEQNHVDICREANTQHSDPRVHCHEERSKAQVVENCQCTSALMEND